MVAGDSRLPDSPLVWVLKSLMPYSRANLEPTYKPGKFFNDLEKISNAKRRSLQNAFYHSQKSGLVELDNEGVPHLTEKGWRRVRRYEPKKLGENARLMVIFDIPEAENHKRVHLRRLLYELKFEPVQKSVWTSRFDHRELIKAEIKEYQLSDYVQVYEALRLN